MRGSRLPVVREGEIAGERSISIVFPRRYPTLAEAERVTAYRLARALAGQGYSGRVALEIRGSGSRRMPSHPTPARKRAGAVRPVHREPERLAKLANAFMEAEAHHREWAADSRPAWHELFTLRQACTRPWKEASVGEAGADERPRLGRERRRRRARRVRCARNALSVDGAGGYRPRIRVARDQRSGGVGERGAGTGRTEQCRRPSRGRPSAGRRAPSATSAHRPAGALYPRTSGVVLDLQLLRRPWLVPQSPSFGDLPVTFDDRARVSAQRRDDVGMPEAHGDRHGVGTR